MSARALQKVPQKNDTRVRNNIVQIFNGRQWLNVPNNSVGSTTSITTPKGTNIVHIELKFKCDACLELFKMEDIGDTYGHEPYRLRSICMKCYMKARDKMYGVKSNVDLEDTLYGKK